MKIGERIIILLVWAEVLMLTIGLTMRAYLLYLVIFRL